jgi:hypothetical protein
MTQSTQELQQLIERQQMLLNAYEESLSLEDDPRRRHRLQESIEDAKQQLLTFQTQLAHNRDIQKSPTPVRQQSTFIANAPYGLESTLVGRQDELFLLDDWYNNDTDHPLLALIGLGGMGKSALAWHWMTTLLNKQQAPSLVIWWSFYETDGTVDKLVAEALSYFGDKPDAYPTLRASVTRFMDYLRRTPALIILDGAERLLRAYSGLNLQQARQFADPVAGNLLRWLAQPGLTQARTLMTSRLLPQELTGQGGTRLAGVRRHSLTGLDLEGAYQLFTGLGITATRAEVEAVSAPLGYHPLSLRLLASYVAHDPKTPNDLQAAVKYNVTDDLLGKRQHILARAYNNLPQATQELLSRLAAFRSGVDWDTIQSVFGDSAQIQRSLNLLIQRGLLQQTVHERKGEQKITYYDLHPAVRRYAYDRLQDSASTHAQLVQFFEAAPAPANLRTLDDLAPMIELFYHLTRAGRYDEAAQFFRDRLAQALYFQFGAYQTVISLLQQLFPDGEDELPRLSQPADQSWVINELARSYRLSGYPKTAIPLLERCVALASDERNLVVSQANLAEQKIVIGSLAAAAEHLRYLIALSQQIEDRRYEMIGYELYGRLLAYTGDWQGAKDALDQAQAQGEGENQLFIWGYRAIMALLRGQVEEGATAAHEMLQQAEEQARRFYPNEASFIRAYWLLGWAELQLGDFNLSQTHLDEALARARAINLVELEPAILIAQARRAYAAFPSQDDQRQQAQSYIEEARQIAERADYRLDLADIYNLQAKLALDQGNRESALQYARIARDYAWCDGPPYAYQAALDEAEQILKLLA